MIELWSTLASSSLTTPLESMSNSMWGMISRTSTLQQRQKSRLTFTQTLPHVTMSHTQFWTYNPSLFRSSSSKASLALIALLSLSLTSFCSGNKKRHRNCSLANRYMHNYFLICEYVSMLLKTLNLYVWVCAHVSSLYLVDWPTFPGLFMFVFGLLFRTLGLCLFGCNEWKVHVCVLRHLCY